MNKNLIDSEANTIFFLGVLTPHIRKEFIGIK